MGAWDRDSDSDRKKWDSDRTVTCKTVQQYMGTVVLQKRLTQGRQFFTLGMFCRQAFVAVAA